MSEGDTAWWRCTSVGTSSAVSTPIRLKESIRTNKVPTKDGSSSRIGSKASEGPLRMAGGWSAISTRFQSGLLGVV